MDTIKKENIEKLQSFKALKEKLETRKKSLGSEYTNWDEKQKLNESIDNLNMFILNQENVVKVLENNGLIYNLTDQHGFQYTNIPDFRKVDSTEFNFDENNVLTIPTPKYIPFIDEAKFREHSYVFDAIRITEDSYLICLGNYSKKQREKNVFCIATLDQLVLIIDYYYLKEKAFNIEIAKRSNEKSRENYFSLSEEKRRYYMFQQGIYYSLSAINKKKISKEDFESLDLEGREKYYLPIKRHVVKRITSKLTDKSMYVSFHNMYEDFIDKTKTIIIKNGKRYANEIVLSYWKDFAKMINYKLSDIRTQREDYSDTYKQAMETSFGESNVDTILKDKYGILIKRQNGDKIKPFEIDLIEKSWVKIQKAYGNLKAESVKNNLKISHSGEKLMFSMKALGVYIPLMGTIGVSNKLGEVDFRSTLSHEVAHFIDNFIGKLNGKRWATDDYESLAGKIAFTFRNSMNKNKNDQTDYINATKECFARAFQQYFGMKTEGEGAITKNVDRNIAPEGIEIWKHPNFVNKLTFKDEVEPLIEQFLKENLDVFETTVDIDGTNDLAPITEEEVVVKTEEPIESKRFSFKNEFGSFTSVFVYIPLNNKKNEFRVETTVRRKNEDGTESLQKNERWFPMSRYNDFIEDAEKRMIKESNENQPAEDIKIGTEFYEYFDPIKQKVVSFDNERVYSVPVNENENYQYKRIFKIDKFKEILSRQNEFEKEINESESNRVKTENKKTEETQKQADFKKAVSSFVKGDLEIGKAIKSLDQVHKINGELDTLKNHIEKFVLEIKDPIKVNIRDIDGKPHFSENKMSYTPLVNRSGEKYFEYLLNLKKPTEQQEESIPELIEGLEILLESLEGEEKKDLEDTIEGLKLLL